ncbi:MarR family transcriptional regulator [Natronolimnobius sp. AArcel1]|nr:MarR family transcriptional regulator [Natronolimnobius sp. AArcel1]
MLAVLFLFIGGLVVLRLLESASDRAYVGSDSSIRSDTDTDTDAPAGDSENHDAPQTHSADTTDHQGYEHTLSPETPPKFLSDEGKVVRLLVANHGRIRQHEITDETGWSKSKVSRICSQMHADDTIEKRSIGRENIIVLSESTPPMDDEELSDQSDESENPLA